MIKSSRRDWILRSIFFGTPLACFGYGSLIEKHLIDVTRADIPLKPEFGSLDGLKIALMSDFHHDDFGDNAFIARAVQTVNDEQVDLVMLAGDYISDDRAALEPLFNELRHLRPGIGTFAVLGNHDRWHLHNSLFALSEDAGVRLLINEAVEYDNFIISGIDSCWGGRPNLEVTLKPTHPDKPVITGWHEPDTFDTYNDPRIILQMSGHTHGGQVCAPAIGPILLPQYGRKYPYGHYQQGDGSLFVTRGIGTMTIPTRFLCAPELAILTLKA
ncbi:MAG: metallophosphoesterase [Verrucomicrobiales bacterium]|nr:metallophosphoesterase [Verrucomicrobiales bacterium]